MSIPKYTIRNIQDKDILCLRNICLATSSGFCTPKKEQALYLLYCDYYYDNCKDTSFVAVDKDDNPVGYILCAPDYDDYKKRYKNGYLKRVFKQNFLLGLEKALLLPIEKIAFAKKYKAHLHIDILESAQRQGLGHRLVDALIKKLKEIGVEGVYLLVGTSNEKGISFYKKYGFEEGKKLPGTIQFCHIAK